MPRKRKVPGETREGGVIPLRYAKQEFETPTFTIIKYTQALTYRNRDVCQRELSKDEVREQYTLALLSLYHPDDAQYLRLIDQAESPAYNDYWSELADRDRHLQQKKTRDPTTGFRISSRMLTPANMQKYPHCIVMDHEALGVIIVPELSLRGMNQISIKEIVKAVLEANTDIQALHLYMRPLCEAIIRRVYHFEDATLQQSKLGEMTSWGQDVGQLLESYRLSYDNSPSHRALDTPQASVPQSVSHSEVPTDKVSRGKGKKRVAEEELEPEREKALVDEGKDATQGREDEEEETAGDGSRPSKMSKRSNSEVGRWLDFERELGSASASTSAAPVSFQFTNTALPFRNKD